jgi:hypothetical protein
MEHGATEGEALLPAAGKLGCETIQVRAESVELDNLVYARAKAITGKAVNTAVKGEIFGDR